MYERGGVTLKIANTGNYSIQTTLNKNLQRQSNQQPHFSFEDALEKSVDYKQHESNVLRVDKLFDSLPWFESTPREYLGWLDLNDPDVLAWLETGDNFRGLAGFVRGIIDHGITLEEVYETLDSSILLSKNNLPIEKQRALLYQMDFATQINFSADGSSWATHYRSVMELFANNIISFEAILTAPVPNIATKNGELHYNSGSGFRPLSDLWENPILPGLEINEHDLKDWWVYFWNHMRENGVESHISENTKQFLKSIESTFAQTT